MSEKEVLQKKPVSYQTLLLGAGKILNLRVKKMADV
jgi:hypothetical protein